MARQLTEYMIRAYSEEGLDSLIPELQTWGIKLVHRYTHLTEPTICVLMTSLLVNWYGQDPRIKHIEMSGDFGVGNRQEEAPHHIDRLDQRNLPLTTTFTFSSQGTGTVVYILDSGCRFDHVEFGGRVSPVLKPTDATKAFDPFFDELENIQSDDRDFGAAQLRLKQPRGIDELGHGTHVTGIVGSSTYGVAKNVTLKTARVFGLNGVTSTGKICAGIEAIKKDFLDSGALSAVCNMSFGGSIDISAPETLLEAEILALVNIGITVVAAAGNSAKDANGVTPARLDEVITVGAVDQNDSIANFSNFGDSEDIVAPEDPFQFEDFEGSNTGSAVDLFAPGTRVVSTWHQLIDSVNTLSGTSMASPAVAGVAALVLEATPSLSPSDVALSIDVNVTPNVISFDAGTLPSTPNKLLYSIFVDHAIEWITPGGLLGEFAEGQGWVVKLEANGFSGNSVTFSDVTPGGVNTPGRAFRLPIGSSLNPITGEITSPGDTNGQFNDVNFEFTIRASDGISFSDRTFVIKIFEFDLPPLWNTAPDLGAIEEGSPLALDFSATARSGPAGPFSLTFTPVDGLPHGWNLDHRGFLSGIAPLVVNKDLITKFTVRVADAFASADREFTIRIKQRLDILPEGGEPGWITPAGNIGTAFPGIPFSFIIKASDVDDAPQLLKYFLEFTSGGGSQFGPSGSLPTGFTLNEDTGEISGTYVDGTDTDFEFAVFVSDGANIVGRSFTITGFGSPENIPPVWITPEGNIGSVNSFEVFSFDLIADDPDTQPQGLLYTLVSGALPSGINLDSSTGTVAGPAPLVAVDTNFAFTVNVSDGLDSATRTFAVVVNRINIGPEWQTPEGQISEIHEGENFAFALQATDENGDDLEYSLVSGSLPPIVSLNPHTGVLSGPAHNVEQDTSFLFTIRVNDDLSNPLGQGISVDRDFSIKVLEGPLSPNEPPVWITPTGFLTQAFEEDDYFFQLEAIDPDNEPTEITYIVTSGSLPPGLALNQNTGAISGSVQTDENITDDIFAFTVSAFDGIDSTLRDFSIEVIDLGDLNQAPEWITPEGALGSFNEAAFLSIVLEAFDPDGDDLAFSVVGGILPPGLSVDTNTGIISGVPDQVVANAIFVFVLRIEDPFGEFADRNFNITILNTANIPPIWITPAGFLGEVDELAPTLFALNATDPDSTPLPLTFSVTSGFLPPGLGLDSNTGIISGTPNAVASDTLFPFEVTVSDGVALIPRSFSITVKDVSIFPGPFTNLSVPLLGNLRTEWRRWNTSILIDDDSLFLPADPNFGRVSPVEPTDFRKEPKVLVANNLHTGDPDAVFSLLGIHHRRFKILLSAPDFALVRNIITGDVIYEVIYLRIIDPQEGSAFTIPNPNFVSRSFDNLRQELLISIGNDDVLPDWMTSEQIFGDPSSALGYTPAVVMAFVKPNRAKIIVEGLNEITESIIEIQNSPSTFDSNTTTFDSDTTTFDDFKTTIVQINKGIGHQLVGREMIVDRYLFENTIDEVKYLKFNSDTPNPIWITSPGLLGTFSISSPITPIALAVESPIGLTNFSFVRIFGDLPDGLTLNPSTGQIAGTPTTAEEKSFVIKVEDDDGNSSIRRFRINTVV